MLYFNDQDHLIFIAFAQHSKHAIPAVLQAPPKITISENFMHTSYARNISVVEEASKVRMSSV